MWRWAGNRRHEQRGDRHRARSHCEHDRRIAHGEEHPGDGGGDEDAETLDPPRDDVRRRQLVGCPRQRGREGRLRRPRHRDRARRKGREHIDNERVGAGCQRRRRQPERGRLNDVAHREHPRRPVAVGGRGRERRDEGGRHELCERDEPGGRCSALLEGVDENRDPRSPLRGVEAGEGQQHPPQVAIADDRDERVKPSYGARSYG